MKQGDLLNLNVLELGDGGEGVAVHEDRTVFVPLALPGEEVTARVMYLKRDTAAFAQLKEVKKVSPVRVESKCSVFGLCGGCQLLHMSYAAQLEFKRKIVQTKFERIGNLNVDVEPVVPSPSVTGYRNKVQQPVGWSGGAKVGFFKNGTHDLVPVKNCLLQDENLRAAAGIFEEFLNKYGLSVYREKTGKGLVRHFVGRFVDGQLLFVVVVNGDTLPHANELFEMLSARFDRIGLFVNVNKAATNVILGERTHHIAGLYGIRSEACGAKFELQANSFFQVNLPVAEKIYRAAKEEILKFGPDALIECYSGIGVLSAMLADDSYDSFGIEIVRAAWQDAEKIKRANGLNRLVNICGDVNTELPKLAGKYVGKKVAVIVDPPRKGLDKKVRETIIDMSPRLIVYVSCDCATLARDVADFAHAGYTVEQVRPFDLFPNTKHVETLVVLSHKQTRRTYQHES